MNLAFPIHNMRYSLIQDALRLDLPDDYFTGRSAEDICIPRNLIVFSRKTTKDLQRKSFDGYPHHRYVLVFNLMTEGTVNVDGIHWRLKPENALMVFPYQFHHFIDLADRNLVWLFITFELELPTAMQTFRHRMVSMDQRCHQLLARILLHYENGTDDKAKRRLTLDCSLLINHLREQVSTTTPSPLGVENAEIQSNALIRSIQTYLISNSGSLQSGSDIASALHMSESNLRAVFRQQFNISLGAYIKNFRAHQAIQLMQNPTISFTDIAFELGFTTLSSFSRFFTNTIGISPRKYRQSVKQGFRA